MSRIIQCMKLKREAEGLDSPPFPGAEGQYIFENISRDAWQQWVNLQTMLINEHRLTPFEPQARKFLQAEREKFLFGDGAELPEGFTPEKPD